MFVSCGKFQAREPVQVTPVQSSFETIFSQTSFHSVPLCHAKLSIVNTLFGNVRNSMHFVDKNKIRKKISIFQPFCVIHLFSRSMVFDHIGPQKANSWNCDDLAHRSTLSFFVWMSFFSILYCAWTEKPDWRRPDLYHITLLLSCQNPCWQCIKFNRSCILANSGFIEPLNSPLMARNVQSSFEQGRIFCLSCCLQKTSRKTSPHSRCVTQPSCWSFDTQHVCHIPDDKHAISQKHNTNLYWLL